MKRPSLAQADAFLAGSGAPPDDRYWLVRGAVLRGLAFIYFLGFLSLAFQLPGLLGSGGLLPISLYLERAQAVLPAALDRWLRLPTLFWFSASDAVLSGACWTGLFLSLAALAGRAGPLLWATLWAIYSSFVHAGQVFYGYGWEMMQLEAGFLAIFLSPWRGWNGKRAPSPPPRFLIWLLRWMVFRVMFGAGLIKIRGDACWRDLTCLVYHYETQPIPSPISWYLHQMPVWFHKTGVLWNHFVELIVPFFVFGPKPARRIAGVLLVGFQAMLIASGNLSWLNYLTLFLCLACFDDAFLRRWIPERFRTKFRSPEIRRSQGGAWKGLRYAYGATVILLSWAPTVNLLSPKQAMNRSFDPFHWVNTYGAFGHVGKTRREVVLQGSLDGKTWKDYEFFCKPGRVDRRPCFVAPYHRRVDWQIWFAAMQHYRGNPWLVHLVHQLLENKPSALSLIRTNPFPDPAPRWIRAVLYEYSFSERDSGTRAWWKRKSLGLYLPPLAKDNPTLLRFLEMNHLRRAQRSSPKKE